MKIAQNADRQIVVILPSDPKHSAAYQKLLSHRHEYFSKHAPHLNASDAQRRDKAIDSNSICIICLKDDELVSSIRLTPPPFEASVEMALHGIDLNDAYKDCIEMNRFTFSAPDSKQNVFDVRYLLCVAGKIAFDNLSAKGLIAICREEKLKLFETFGVKPILNFHFASRKAKYYLVYGDKDTVLSTTALSKNNLKLLNGESYELHTKAK
jgi:hypothetical protein